MKYCPNLACRSRQRGSPPAEFEDRIEVCSDCGSPLTSDAAAALAGVQGVPLAEARGYREPPARGIDVDPEARRKAARVDVLTGAVLVAGSLLLPVCTYLLAYWSGGGKWVISILPFFYGVYRLGRGLNEGS